MPGSIPAFSKEEMTAMPDWDLQDIAYAVSGKFLQGDVPDDVIESIARGAIDFDAPLRPLTEGQFILELFHGPTLAFKDFGARFMARLMGWLVREDNQPLTILVATSGDTGGAVASGFLGVEGIEVIILYPSGKVSPLQEKQLTTLSRNITALEIDGTFDDCQRLVKQAFLDPALAPKYRLTSANSINISRLIPQTFYYHFAATRRQLGGKPIVFSVPSGNFGNLSAGLIAQRMGAPIAHFIAATNINDVVPQYLASGHYEPKPSIATLSNAMDVGNPSNFWRILDLIGHDPVRITGFAFTDDQTRQAMREVYHRMGYILDPHSAVGYLGLQKAGVPGIILGTAHPAKFREEVEKILSIKIGLPASLEKLQYLEKKSLPLPPEYEAFRTFLLERG